MTAGRYNVLLVDDNDDHCMLIEDLLTEQGFARRVLRHPDAESALATLLQPSASKHAPPLPDFIFLDIRLPGMNGIECLRQLKSHAETRHIPTLMLTTSQREEEIHDSFAAGACGYVVKPVDFAVLAEKIQALKQYWDQASELPTVERAA
jgi:CheY-like chemotaxis protein